MVTLFFFFFGSLKKKFYVIPDWDQRAVAQPDAALQDLIAVLHPSLALPGYWRRWIWNMYTEHPFVGGNNNGAGVTEYDCASRTMADFERPSPVLGQSCE